MLRMLPEGLDFVLEAPCRTWRETISLRRRCAVPIMLDELVQQDDDLMRMISEDVADGIGLKVSKAGGLTRARRHRDICLAAGATISVQDTVGSTIAFAAIAHLGATVPERQLRCVLDCRGMVSIETAGFDAPIVGGGVLVPNRPGLGLTVDPDGEPLETWAS
jgi:L-alanine-DL-glutamate epimerase-like enolase superfamily enzyme